MCATHYTPEQRATGPIECQRPASRRGATLVLVLGALALISILTIVYVSVGRADRRTSAAATESTQRNANVERFIEHIGGVIGDDVTSTYIESVGANGPRFARETVDLPVTSPGFMSVVPSTQFGENDLGDRAQLVDRFRFRPEGSVTRRWDAPSNGVDGFLDDIDSASGGLRNPALDYRSISDPFLAQTLPTDIDGDAVRLAGSGADAAALLYLERRDWGHISNFAPDGRFVNLYNLRAGATHDGSPWNGVLAGRSGSFNAPSGFSEGGAFDLERQIDLEDDVLAMSDGLTLWEPRVNAADPWIAEARYRSPGDSLSPGIDLTNATDRAMINLPYVWDTNQRELFRPASDLPDDPGWDNPTYWQYQYADADGDGFLDSRWQELVDASDARNIRNLAGGGEYRLFFAARAIDLSSLVNVNTAADFSASPIAADDDGSLLSVERIGASPAEIDLRRILSMEDVWFDVARDGFAAGGYASFVQPDDLPGGNPRDDGDYANYRSLIVGTGADPVTGQNRLINGPGYLGARGATAAIRRTLFDAVTPPSGPQASGFYTGALDQLSDPDIGLFSNVLSPYEQVPIFGSFQPTMGVGSRVRNFNQFSGVYPGSNAGGTGSSALFGVDDLGELLAFWGANDDEVTTRLEVAAGGRGASLNAVGDAYHLSPLRSDRPLDLELTRGNWDGDNNYEFAEAQRDLLWSLFNARRYLTTVSGARPFAGEVPISEGFLDRSRAGTVFAGDTRRYVGGSPASGGLTYDLPVPALATEINPLNEQAARNAFQIYRDLLLPYENEIAVVDPGDVWTLNPSMSTPFAQQTESYGYRGPAFAARLAAHMAANVVDQIDREPELTENWSGTTAIRLGVDDGVAPTFVFDNEVDVTDPLNNLLSNQAINPSSLGAVEDVVVFGVEAQPFIVEAASFSAYVDTPFSTFGDQDWDPSDTGGLDAQAFSSVVTIDSAVDRDNTDFLFQVFAVQLSNPFQTTVRLDNTYIEFADQIFSLVSAPPLGPGETVIVYSVTPEDFEVAMNVTRLDGALGSLSGFDLETWLESNLGGRSLDLVRLGRAADMSGNAPFRVSAGTSELEWPTALLADASDSRDVHNLFDDSGSPGGLETVMLWRRGTQADRSGDVLVDRLAETQNAGTLNTVPEFANAGGQVTNGDGTSFIPANGTATTGEITGLFQQADGNDDPEQVYALVFASSIVRPSVASGTLPSGALPAWAIEVKDASGGTQNSRNSIRVSLSPSMPDEEAVSAASTSFVLIDTTNPGNGSLADLTSVLPTMSQLPEGKSADDIDASVLSNRPLFNERYQELALAPQGTPVIDRPSLRTGDLLLPLAVGPFFKEGVSVAGTRIERLEDEWTTLGEAMGYALGYARDVSPNTTSAMGDDSLDGVGGLVNASTYDPAQAKLDNGRLDLDRYVLFTDSDIGGFDQVFDPIASGVNAATGRYNEQTRGLAIPAALRIFSLVTAGDELATYGNAERPLMGTVNLNTAPLAVLRTLPTLSPANTIASGNGFGAATFDQWWPKRQDDTILTDPTTPGPVASWPPADPTNPMQDTTPSIDIAGTIAAYRDRTPSFARPPTNPPAGGGVGGALPPINDFFSFDGTIGGLGPDPLFVHPDALTGREGRVTGTLVDRSGIAGMREAPGLLSVGELFGARLAEADPLLLPEERFREQLRGVDGLAQDGASLITRGGVDYVNYVNNLTAPTFIESDTIADDYEEQLVVLNALANTASVRSDFYAVWMIVQGFRESDVTDLSPSEPLTPSFRDRYLLVFDRSNVTEAGDQPRLVYRRLLNN